MPDDANSQPRLSGNRMIWRARFLRGAGIIAAGYLASLALGKWVLIAAIAGVVAGTVADVWRARGSTAAAHRNGD